MSNEDRVLNIAKKCMLEYMSDGKVKMPSDFDEDFLGGIDTMSIFGITDMAWNKTPFCRALGKLIEEEKITFWLDDDNNYCYQIK